MTNLKPITRVSYPKFPIATPYPKTEYLKIAIIYAGRSEKPSGISRTKVRNPVLVLKKIPSFSRGA